jgi:hypothetical protein
MKHGFVLIAILSLTAILATGCKSGGTSAAKTVSDSAAKEMTLATTTVEREANVDSTIQCKFTIDYPTGSDSLSLAVCKFLHSELANNYLPRINDIEGNGNYPLYSGDVTKGEAVAGYYADGTLKYLKQQVKEMIDEGYGDQPTMSYELKMSKTVDTTRYVSYDVQSYAYLGGAHGSSTYYVVNIAKPSGKVLTQTVDSLQLKALQPILRKGIISYFNEDGSNEVNESNLKDQLLLDGDIIPLPVHAPYLAADGVYFLYQQYEIGPYAIGMVGFVVPYSEIKQYLTKEALQLIE